MVVTVLAVLAGVAVPLYRQSLYQTRATQIFTDCQAVRSAAHMYYMEHESWPSDGSPGALPASLAPHLNATPFAGPGYVLDWDEWSAPEGTVVGISVVPSDPELEAALDEVLGQYNSLIRLDGRYMLAVEATFPIERFLESAGGRPGGERGQSEWGAERGWERGQRNGQRQGTGG